MSTFNEEETRLLDKTIRVREQIIDNLLLSKLPTAARDVEVFATMLDSMDRSIHNRKKITIDDASQKSDSESKEILKTLLMSLHSNEVSFPNAQPVLEHKPPEYVPQEVEILEGELVVGHDPAIEAMMKKSIG